MTPLTREVLCYQKTGDGFSDLFNQIIRLAYAFPAGQIGFTEEDGAEFLLQFIPRVSRLISRYRETGQSFESYLGSTMRWQLKSFAARRAAERVRSTALCGPGGDLQSDEEARMARPEPCGLEVRDSGWKRRGQTCCIPSSPGGDSAGGAKCSSGLSGGQRRRLLHMSLKLSERLGEEDYRRVAVATGCDPAWLLNCWQQLRLGCTEQRERRAAFQARRDRAWFKIRCLQYRLRLHLDDEERRVAERQLGMWRRRYEHARRILDRMQFGPTHADIAKVLAVPKGTVDSSVFYGKRELRDPAYVATLASAVSNP